VKLPDKCIIQLETVEFVPAEAAFLTSSSSGPAWNTTSNFFPNRQQLSACLPAFLLPSFLLSAHRSHRLASKHLHRAYFIVLPYACFLYQPFRCMTLHSHELGRIGIISLLSPSFQQKSYAKQSLFILEA
jgi:hypothetical protein